MRAQPLCLLHLIPADGIGGVETAAKSMAERTDLSCVFRLQFIESHVLGGFTPRSAAKAMMAHWRAFSPASDLGPDVIIASLWRSVPLALILKAMCPQAKLVYFLHNNVAKHKLDYGLSRLAVHVADEVWADSAATLSARGSTGRKGRVISFVTERRPLISKPFCGPHFVSWGRLNRQKGFDRAIHFIRLLADRGIDARYDLYGPDDGEGTSLKLLIDKLNLHDRVRIAGAISRDQLSGIAAKASFFLQPSRSEGMCMAVVEAMQHGLVPVTTQVGEMANYVIPDRTGVIISPERMEDAISMVAMLVDAPAAWRRLSNRAMRRWHDAPIYAEDVCRAAIELAGPR